MFMSDAGAAGMASSAMAVAPLRRSIASGAAYQASGKRHGAYALALWRKNDM